jgi:hypothetical protein
MGDRVVPGLFISGPAGWHDMTYFYSVLCQAMLPKTRAWPGRPNMTRWSGMSPRMPLVGFLQAVLVCGNILLVVNSIGQSHNFQKRTPASLACKVTNPGGPHPISLPLTAIEAMEKVKYLLPASYIGLLGPYHQHVISTFNTCSRGRTHQSLTNTGVGYNLGGVVFPHHSPCSIPV